MSEQQWDVANCPATITEYATNNDAVGAETVCWSTETPGWWPDRARHSLRRSDGWQRSMHRWYENVDSNSWRWTKRANNCRCTPTGRGWRQFRMTLELRRSGIDKTARCAGNYHLSASIPRLEKRRVRYVAHIELNIHILWIINTISRFCNNKVMPL